MRNVASEELSLEQLDGAVGGGGLGRPLVDNRAAQAIVDGAKAAWDWMEETFNKYKDKRGDSFEHWG